MRTSHRQIRKRILDAKSKISDEEFFSSRAYNGYLTDLAEAATKRYKRPLRVRVVADHDDDTVAFTDYHGIYINACNHITWSLPTRLLRSMSLEGFNAHECGHNLFTDNRIWNSYFSKLEKGKFYPKMPDGLDSMQKLHARDILEAVLDETDTVPYQVIMSVAHALQNILEDGYVDARYSYEFPGSPAKGIALNNLRFADTVPEISEMINRKYYDHSIVLNLLIQYIRAHEVNNLSGYTGEFIDKLYQYIPLVDECVYDDDARSRCETVSKILIDLWPMMQRCFDALRDKKKQAQQQAQQQKGVGSGSGSGGVPTPGQSGSGDDEDDNGLKQGKQAVEEDLSSQLPKAAPNFTMKTTPVPSNGSFTPDPGQMNAIRAQAERVISEESDRIAAHLTNSITSSGSGGVDQNSEYDGYDYEHAAEDIERLLEHMAEEKVTEELEEELSEELQREANSIRYGNAHRNIHITVNRMKKRSGCVKNEKDLSSEDLSILVQHRMLLGLWSQPVLRKRSWMRNISGSARAMTRPLMNGQWIATIGDGSCVRFAAELSRMRRCPITVAREVQTGESVPIVHEMVVANPHSWLDIIRMMVYY